MSHPFLRRAAGGAAIVTALAAAVVAADVSAPSQASQPTADRTSSTGRQASLTSVALPAVGSTAARAAGAVKATTTALAPRGTRDFGLVGVTWARGTGLGEVTVQVRTRSHGTWSGWTSLDADENDPAAAGERQGSDPLWVGTADGVAARVTASSGTAPRDVRVDLVDPGAGPATGTADRASATSRSASSSAVRPAIALAPRTVEPPAYTAMPALVSRGAWGAKANKTCDSPRYGSRTLGIVFHHTVGTNSYTKGQSAGIVRSIQAYHMNGRGWCDIGYNFLVDKYGQIFEGRSGGVNYQVRGAHAGNSYVNTYAMGVSMMGNLDTAAPTGAMKNSTIKLMGWRLGTNYVSAGGSYAVGSKGLLRVSGHRDIYNRGIRPATSTACPGKYGYAWLTSTASTGLRPLLTRYVSKYSTPIKTKWTALGGESLTGPVYTGEAVVAGTTGHWTRFSKGTMYYLSSATGAHLVSGATYTAYAAAGGPRAKIGFPTSDKTDTTGTLRVQQFQGGHITEDTATGQATVTYD